MSGRFLFQAYGVGYGVTGMLTLLDEIAHR